MILKNTVFRRVKKLLLDNRQYLCGLGFIYFTLYYLFYYVYRLTLEVLHQLSPMKIQ